MKYLIDKKIEFEWNPKTSLYGWCIREVSLDGYCGPDLIPASNSLFFTAKDIRLVQSFEVDSDRLSDTRKIEASLRFGSPHTDSFIEREWVSMIGTDRKIDAISLSIFRSASDTSKETCSSYAYIAYKDEQGEYDQNDLLQFNVDLTAQKFDRLEELIKATGTARLFFRAKIAHGFYSEWSPNVGSTYYKILTTDEPHEQPAPPTGRDQFPKIGYVKTFSIQVESGIDCLDKE